MTNEYRLVVRTILSSDGQVKSVLLDLANGLPVPLASIWAVSLAKKSRPNTVKSYLSDIKRLYQWAEKNSISLLERMASGVGFSRVEIEDICDFATKKIVPPFEGVSSSTFNRRIAAFVSFINFHMERYLDRAVHDPKKYAVGTRQLKKMNMAFFDRQKNQFDLSNESQQTKSLTAKQVDAVLEVMDPESASNPFLNDALKVRNLCMFKISIECLLRRSEVVLLEIDDLELEGNPTVKVKLPTPSNMIKRKDGASIKTYTRMVPIPKSLADLLSVYIEQYRDILVRKGVITKALFLSYKTGERLSAWSANSYLKSIRVEGVNLSDGDIHAHVLRVTGANKFKKEAESALVKERALSKSVEIQEMMSYLGGWSRRSSMCCFAFKTDPGFASKIDPPFGCPV